MTENTGARPHTPRIVRQLWWLALAASIALLLLSLPGYLGALRVPETSPGFAAWGHLSAWFELVFSLSAAVLSLGLAVLLYWKKRNEPMGLFLSYFLLQNGILFCGPIERLTAYWLPQFPYLGLQLQGLLFAVPSLVLILIFPNGHFVPRWSRALVPIGAILILLTLTLDAEESVKLNSLRAQILTGMVYSILLLAVGVQVYRYRRLYTPLERQQTKWVAYGTAFYFSLLFLLAIPYYYSLNLPPGAAAPRWLPFLSPLWWLTLNIFPISFTLAIFRARLWDIDVIIRRTVTYAVITFASALVYFGSVIALQQVFASIIGSGQNEVVTVLSTLAIAALFVPLRSKIQNVIDRRFYRKKYDAQRVLANYAESVRDETDLEKLIAKLMQVVEETIQPQCVSVSLRKDSVPEYAPGRDRVN